MTHSDCDVTRKILDIGRGDQVDTYTRHTVTDSIFDVHHDLFEM